VSEEKLYDVIIYHLETKSVDAIVGEKMPLDKGFYNAEKRLVTAFGRINSNYCAMIVDTGKYKKGDVVSES